MGTSCFSGSGALSIGLAAGFVSNHSVAVAISDSLVSTFALPLLLAGMESFGLALGKTGTTGGTTDRIAGLVVAGATVIEFPEVDCAGLPELGVVGDVEVS